MDLFQHYRRLAGYDEWANLEVISSLRAIHKAPERSLKWTAHIVAAEHVWLARLLQEKQKFAVWPDLTLDQCEEEVRGLARAWRDYLDGGPHNLLEQIVPYKNSKGESWTSSVQDILTHVFMHSAYHRGQIASDMRQAGNVPTYTDFIHGVRQGLVE